MDVSSFSYKGEEVEKPGGAGELTNVPSGSLVSSGELVREIIYSCTPRFTLVLSS
jgi:hypothetical protein